MVYVGEERSVYGGLIWKPQGKRLLENLGIVGRIIFKLS
jgi:hypothetical protein